jgi:UDP:flavonoid glycosyltransferase YjiC (YdhE family)
MTRIIIAATPVYGHVAPLILIAVDLVAQGHHVTFLGGSAFKSAIEKTGASFAQLASDADFDLSNPAAFPARALLPAGPAQMDFDLRHLFIDPLAGQHAGLQTLLRAADHENPGEPVVLLHDTAFMGAWPVLLGAPGMRPCGVIGLGIVPLPLTSVDTAPFGFGLAPDSSESGRIRNRELNRTFADEMFAATQAHLVAALGAVGARDPAPFVFDAMVALPDRYLQMSIAALEYERSDAPVGLRYVGALPLATSHFIPPPWWDRLGENRKVVVVTQGTIANRDFDELIKPTLDALVNVDVVVVALTGRPDVDLGDVPANAVVAEFIPFDRLMPLADVLISNGGYGGIQQALICGVPLVLAGESEDKTEVAARAAHTGAAINLKSSRPSVEALRAAVLAALYNPRYVNDARRLQVEYSRHDALSAVNACVHELDDECPSPT